MSFIISPGSHPLKKEQWEQKDRDETDLSSIYSVRESSYPLWTDASNHITFSCFLSWSHIAQRNREQVVE